jgi:spermidine synthase
VVTLLYLLFFLSGAAALVYEVVWVRSLSLVFGASHLAVATVLSVFMGGLALGSWAIGRRIDDQRRLLRLYGLLEIGIALSAAAFLGLMKLYPAIYVPVARAAGESPLILSAIRVLFGVVAMIVPAALMGGTLPVLSRFAAARAGDLSRHLSLLYGLNTLGAVAGALAAGFVLLQRFGAAGSVGIAITANLAIGLCALALRDNARAVETPRPALRPDRAAPSAAGGTLPYRLVMWGIGISGFCALGYEVLWTRILSMVLGTSTHSFTIMLVAFLAGIALGSQAYGIFGRRLTGSATAGAVTSFGLVQVAIGVTALAVTYFIRDLPAQSIRLQSLLLHSKAPEFEARVGASFLVAFGTMFVPAFFMGLAFPLAGKVHGDYRRAVGRAVGEVLAYNTVGAILGAAVSGFVLIYLFGIERSLLLLSVLNVGMGACIASARHGRRALPWALAGAAAAVLAALALAPAWFRLWDAKYFAIYRNNQRDAFETPEKVRDAMENTDVLFFHEGVDSTLSVIRPRGAHQALLVNGKIVASSTRQDVQCQYTLGHLPMLLHPDPEKVFVLGMGTAMTAGATSVHPEVESITLAEIEPSVAPAARTFHEANHDVLDHPKLRVVWDDGRNWLLTTGERYDVITADPIHPWTRGSAYLYTREYYALAADRLNPGGIMCQWLPIYELTARDLASVVRTFGESFEHMMLWLTHYDAELIGSNSPIVIDTDQLARRLAHPAVSRDLASVEMGSVPDFLSYFVMGTAGLRAFGRNGVVNTDDNLYLEFSAPRSVGMARVMGDNVEALGAHRESIAPYLRAHAAPDDGAAGDRVWELQREAGELYDRAHALFLWGRHDSREFADLLARLEREFPGYAPAEFLGGEYRARVAQTPTLYRHVAFDFAADDGARTTVEISAVTMRIGGTRAAVVFVDNRAREIYGQVYLDGNDRELDAALRSLADRVLVALQGVYDAELAQARDAGFALPPPEPTLSRMRTRIADVSGTGLGVPGGA